MASSPALVRQGAQLIEIFSLWAGDRASLPADGEAADVEAFAGLGPPAAVFARWAEQIDPVAGAAGDQQLSACVSGIGQVNVWQ